MTELLLERVSVSSRGVWKGFAKVGWEQGTSSCLWARHRLKLIIRARERQASKLCLRVWALSGGWRLHPP